MEAADRSRPGAGLCPDLQNGRWFRRIGAIVGFRMISQRWVTLSAAGFCLILAHAKGATLNTSIESVSSQFDIGASDRRAIHCVDGSGLDANNPPGHTNNPDGTMWLNTGDGTFGGGPDPRPNGDLAQITFNLGGLSSLDSFRVWNYNEVNLNDRSVQTLTISIATTAGGPFTLLTDPNNNSTTWTFDQAPGTAGYTGELFNLSTPVQAGYVRFDLLTNYDAAGTDHGFVGLSEIQFYGTAAVPEPSTWMLLGVGFLGLIGLRVIERGKLTS
jgi:hypothetical protein